MDLKSRALSEQAEEVMCTYPLWWKVWVLLLTLPFTLVGIFLFVLAFLRLIGTVVHKLAGSLASDPFAGEGPALLFVALMSFVLLFIPVQFINMYSDVRLSQKGIEVQVFWLWWILVSWEDVIAIRPTTVSALLGHRRSQLVVVRRLTFFHRILGWIYGYTVKPAFIIKGTQRGYHDAVRLIRERLDKQAKCEQ